MRSSVRGEAFGKLVAFMGVRIILVRHGETEANRLRRFAESDDIPLTEEGRRQALELASRIAREFRPELLFSSLFARARQTSEIIGAAVALVSEVLPGIHERDFGSLRGHPYTRMGEMMRTDERYDPERPWLWAPHNGESLEQVRLRATVAVESLESRGAREIVVVCHGAVVQAICAHITGEWRESYVPANCGYALIEKGRNGWSGPVVSGEWESLSDVI
jgi:broad specificity phosphatase PhoE